MAHTPPLRITHIDGSFNQIPVFELEVSGGTLTSLSPSKVKLAISPKPVPGGFTWLDSTKQVDLTKYKPSSVDEIFIGELLYKFSYEELKMVLRNLHDIGKTIIPIEIYDNKIKDVENFKIAMESSFIGEVKMPGMPAARIGDLCAHGGAITGPG